MDILSTNKHKAAKVHKCSYCDQDINIGEVYERQCNVYDGQFYTWKSHLRCMEICSTLNMYEDCDEGVTQDDFNEIITENYLQLTNADGNSIPDFETRLNYVCGHYLPNK